MMEREGTNVQKERSFEDFLIEDNCLDEVDAIALKRVIAWQLSDKMKADGISKTTMAARMATSRSQVERLLDPENPKMQLDTIQKAANVLNLRMSVRFEPTTAVCREPA